MFTGLAHVAYNARNIETMLDFYVNKLGCEELFRINDDQGQLVLLFLRITDTQTIEIFPATSDPEERPARAAGFNHICLEVENIEDALNRLRERGVPVERDVTMGRSGSKLAFIRDPEGNRIELMQILPTSMLAQSIARLRAQRS